ncbi:hypothetical protein EDB87DRAFT_426010 [Lactarius vividus]|nr:hypothetical protein EDB87DRAFT_426010 [Lactarius vividus]
MLEDLDTRIVAGPPPHPTHVYGLGSAIGAAPPMGKEALTPTLAELHDDDEFEAFVARISNLYGPYHVSDTSIVNILDLMAPSSEGGSILAPRLHNFFKACLPEMSTWDPDVRKRRLRVCLAAIWSYARAYCNSDPPIPGQFQRLFTDPDDIDIISAEGDTDTRVMVFCITSFLVKKNCRGYPPLIGEPTSFQRRIGLCREDTGLVLAT